MVDPLERLTNLVALLLETRRPLTFEDVSHELAGQYPESVSARRTAFERDKAVLREQSIPIEQVVLAGSDAGKTGYWIDRSRFELPDLGLEPDETRALQVAVAAVRQGVDWAEDALRKVGPAPEPGEPPAAGSLAAALPSVDTVPELFAANAARSTVTFGYRGTERRLDPYGLLSRQGFWYVVGWDHASDALRTYRVDRIEGAVLAGEPGGFEVPEGFDPAAAFPADAKLLGEDAVVDARVWVSAHRASAVLAELGEGALDERRPDGSVVVVVPYANRWAFRSWVLGLLDDAEVLGPPEARDQIVTWLRAMAASR